MKQKDIALIILIVAIAGILSMFISKQIFATPKNRQQKVEVVQPITADFPKPDERYFNSQSFDPTQTITIGGNANPDPFSGKPQQ
ncbi:MAG TPA: hypothetical protein VHA05_01310 [Candidatus Saccharimonadales bacterium]|jgi:hypothetical protein|nr:hypothetical protein [Candidatus Saccharimonadales bacterium]